MAKLATSALSKFWASKVQEKKTTIKLVDDQIALTVKVDGGVKSTSSADVATFLREHIVVKVSNKGEDEHGTPINQSGVASGKDTAAGYLAYIKEQTAAPADTDDETQQQTNGHTNRVTV